MSESRKSFWGKTVSRKVISWLLVFAMLFGLAPADFSLVAKAAGEMNITVHYQTDWTTPAVQAWDGTYTLTGNGDEQEVEGWDGAKATPMTAEEDGWYSINIKGSVGGFQFLDLDDPNKNNTNGTVYDAAMANYNEDTATDLYYINGVWYLNKEGTEEMPLSKPVKASIHFYNAEKFTTPVINAWNNVTVSGNDGKAVIEAWGDQSKEKFTAGENGWYTVTLECKSAITGIQIVDAATGTKIELSSQQLAIINACNDTTNGTSVYFDGTVMSLNESDIPIGEVSPGTPTPPSGGELSTPDVPVDMQSPVYNEDGTVTFNVATNEAKAAVKGSFSSWEAISMEAVAGGFTKTLEIPTDGGLYPYGMVTGATDEWVGDPLNPVEKGNPVVVRNPEIGNGTVTIYQPYVGTLDGKVLYRELGSTADYQEKAFEAVEGGKNLYVAVITDAKANVEYEYVIKNGDEEPVSDACNFASVKTVDGTKVTTFTATAEVKAPEYTSPVINADKTVTFNYFSATAKEVYLAGDMNGWAPKATAMIKDEATGLFTVTETLTAGNHEYKFVVDGEWVTDPKNKKTSASGNSIVTVPASEEGVQSPIVDEENGTITFNFDPKDYGLEGVEGVNLMGTVPGTDWTNGLEMTLTEEGYFTITVKDILAGRYQYKFRTSGNSWLTDAKNAEQEGGNSLVIMPGMMISGSNIAGAGQFQYIADGVADEGSVKFSLAKKKVGFSITEDGLLTVKSYAKTGLFTLRIDYAVDGVEKYSVSEFYYTKRAAIYEYTYKDDSKYLGKSDIYTWNNIDGTPNYPFVQKDGKYTAYINVNEAVNSFGYIVRLESKWSGDEVTDREFKDRTLVLNEGERYTKVRGGEGIEVPYVCASGKTCYDNGIIFKYRDDDKFYNGTMDTIKEAKVVINDEEYDMTYNEKDELFTYAFQNIPDGDYEYYFIIDGKEVADQYNPSGKLHYERPEINASYSITPENANYDQNPVVSLFITNSETGEDVELSSIVADITSIAGKEMKVPFSTVTKKGVLYIDRSVESGTYTIPITVTDFYGNTNSLSIAVEVTDKTTTDTSWDESRVYFIVTDRFNDGDASNNGTVGYDTTKAESYHGGDLKGITEKLSYLQELGINTIWITPIVDNVDWIVNEDLTQTGYHGYWAQDFTKLDEHLGTTEDLDELLDEAHKHGIKVMVDVVVNHSGYARTDGTGLENFDGMLRTKEETGTDFLTGGSNADLPDFKTEDAEVRAKLIAWQTAWASHTTAAGNRIDYFRVDTVKHVEHETWAELKAALAEVNPYFKMIGEFYGATISNTGDYLGNGEMDAELDFEFKTVAGSFVNGNIDSAEKSLEARNSVLTSSVTMGQFLSSHDENGFLYNQNFDMAKGKIAASLQMTAKGIPVIYYGEEIGLSGPNSFGVYDNNRYDMKFDNLTPNQEAMLTHYKKLLAAREMYSETFATGTRTKIAGGDEDGYLVFRRGTGNDAVYVAINATTEEKTVTINLNGTVTPDTPAETKTMTDIYSGKTVEVVNNVVEVKIPASTDGGTVILAEGKQMTGIEVVEPAKVEYKVGETLDLSNLTVTGVYGDAKIALSKDAYVLDSSSVDTTKAGTYTVKVTAGDYTDSFTIVVKAAPTAVPTATTAPTVTPTSIPTQKPIATATPTPVPKYTIKYVMNKGTNNKANPTTYSTKNVKLKNPTRKGYTFSGWYTDKKYKNKITTIKASTKKAVTVYAKWTKVKVSKPTIKSVKNSSSKKIQVTLKKKVSGAKGYEISYSYKDNKVKKSVKKVTTTKIKSTIKNLKKGKTYYVKVRAYKLDSTGQKVYSSYSSVKKVTVAK
ncbi:MAG: InlB B-repeat-containing protein [Lachnospiraceae bacterium]|nr:InlB B-repeat-containing protein [Lachnospiraceae bacterium]